MGQTLGGITSDVYKAIVSVVDDRMSEIKVTRQDFDIAEDIKLVASYQR